MSATPHLKPGLEGAWSLMKFIKRILCKIVYFILFKFNLLYNVRYKDSNGFVIDYFIFADSHKDAKDKAEILINSLNMISDFPFKFDTMSGVGYISVDEDRMTTFYK